jgi:CubicO group peptidase (beta-lactamase class C family)
MSITNPRTATRRSVLGALGAAPLAAGAAVAASRTAYAGTPRPSRCGPVPGDLLPGGEFDRLVAARAAQDQFSGTVLLARHGRPVLVRGYGMADRARSIANRPDTLFNLASVTKTCTALAVAQLVRQGTVAFHATLGTYLDGFPAEIANTVTVQQLLTHTAGMGDYSQTPAFAQGLREWSSAAETMDGVMAIIRASPLVFAPGARYGYSNSGFVVLGALVARVSGLSYYDYVRRHVLAPAGMTRSDFLTRPQVLARRDVAHPYASQPGGGGRVDFTTSEYFGYIGGPADGLYSTAADLLAFARALRAGVLLPPAWVELLTGAKVVLSPTEPPAEQAQVRGYGYGFRASVVSDDQRVVGHSGGRPGGATNLDIYPDLDWVAILLGNYDTPLTGLVQRERELICGSAPC